jgi:cAMP-dependent protein kinase regulator
LDETLGSVFDEDEDALWAELEGSAAPQEEQGPQPSSAAAPSAPAFPAADDQSTPAPPAESGKSPASARSPKVTMPLPAAAPPPGLEKPAAGAKADEQGPSPNGGSARAAAPRPRGTAADAGKQRTPEVRLEDIRLFRDLSESSRSLLRSRMVTRDEKRGTVVVKEGDPGNALFVVSSGKVEVTKQGKSGPVHLATLGPGAFFGEFALLSDRRRHATVTVAEDGVFFEISRKVIADLTKNEPSFGNTLRAFYRRRLLNTLIHSAPFFHPLTTQERESLMGRLRFRRIPEKTRIISQGEPGGGFFLILIGTVRVTQRGEDGKERVLAQLGDGTYFGEMSLLKGGNAVASVSTVTPVEIVQLAAAEFYRVLSNYPQIWEEVNREAKRRELANLQILSGRASSEGDDSVVM